MLGNLTSKSDSHRRSYSVHSTTRKHSLTDRISVNDLNFEVSNSKFVLLTLASSRHRFENSFSINLNLPRIVLYFPQKVQKTIVAKGIEGCVSMTKKKYGELKVA